MKNMKMKAFLLAVVACVAQFALADYLMWNVSYEDEYTFAVIYATDSTTAADGTMLTSYISDSSSASGTSTQAVGASSFEGAFVGADVSGYTSSYFYVELYSVSGDAAELIATSSSAVAYDTVSSYVHANLLSMAYNEGQVYSFSSFTAVPEPTGGLLVLMGAALLGLRRKRMA